MSKDDEAALDPADEAVVQLLLRTDRIMEEYHSRAGVEKSFDAIEQKLLVAQIVNQTVLANSVASPSGMTPEAVFGKLDELRERLFEEVKAHIEHVMTGQFQPIAVAPDMPPVPPPTQEELVEINKELQRDGAPDWRTLHEMAPYQADEELLRFRTRRAMASAAPAESAAAAAARKAKKESIHADFEDTLFKGGVDLGHAKATLELLLTTEKGHDMLRLMVHDAVRIRQGRQGPAA